MSTRDEVRVLAASAVETADTVDQLRDYRAKYVRLGVAGVRVLAALALTLERFAAAVEPRNPEEKQ